MKNRSFLLGKTLEPAADAKEQLRRWDAGRTIWTIELGGLGPGYEQAIQVLAIEIVRDELRVRDELTPALAPSLPPQWPEWRKLPQDWAERTVDRINEQCGGFSGAQVAAAKRLAHRWLTIGPAACLLKVPEDCRIQASSFWPHVSAKS